MKIITTILALLVVAIALPAQANDKAVPGMPLTLNYQGRLTYLNGVAFPNDNYTIVVRIWDAPTGGTKLWEETQVVYAFDSVFSAVLGEITPLSPAIDFDQHLWVGIEVPNEISGEMSPRVPMTATPYSFLAADLTGGAAVTSLNGLTDDVSLVAGSGMTITPSGNNLLLSSSGGGGGGADADWGITGDDMYALPTGNVGIGTVTPQWNLHIVGSGINGTRLGIEDNTSLLQQSFQYAALDIKTAQASAIISLHTASTKTLAVRANTAGTDMELVSRNNFDLIHENFLRIKRNGGEVADFTDQDEFRMFTDPSGEVAGLFLRGYDPATGFDGGEMRLADANGNETIRLDGYLDGNYGGSMEMYDNTGNLGLALHGQRSPGNDGGLLELFDEIGTRTIRMEGQNIAGPGSSGGGRINLYHENGTQTLQLAAQEDGLAAQGGVIKLYDENGNVTIELDGDYGNEGRIYTNVLEITGGADFSEQFDIASALADIAPGQVVCIDPESPGALKLSDKAYDTCVAGVVSGAGGVKPGMIMGQRGSVADGAHPVALTGRVYVQADARRGSIKPGDLLTTSDTPGHAMKVGDAGLAQGAILGKAMTGLADGRGLVLVLVSLQ